MSIIVKTGYYSTDVYEAFAGFKEALLEARVFGRRRAPSLATHFTVDRTEDGEVLIEFNDGYDCYSNTFRRYVRNPFKKIIDAYKYGETKNQIKGCKTIEEALYFELLDKMRWAAAETIKRYDDMRWSVNCLKRIGNLKFKANNGPTIQTLVAIVKRGVDKKKFDRQYYNKQLVKNLIGKKFTKADAIEQAEIKAQLENLKKEMQTTLNVLDDERYAIVNEISKEYKARIEEIKKDFTGKINELEMKNVDWRM